jgi:hypothetical protein
MVPAHAVDRGCRAAPLPSPRARRARGPDAPRAGRPNGTQGWEGSADEGDGVDGAWYPPGLATWERDVKEGSRKYRRTSFTPERWAAHRSVGRYWRHLRGMPTSRVVRGLLAPCSFTAGVALLACFFLESSQYAVDHLSSPIPFQITAATLGRATCHVPIGHGTTCHAPTGRPATCHAPTGRGTTCHAPTGCPATCHPPTGRPATCHAPTG